MSTDFRSTPVAADLHVEEWGDGTRVVLLHGSLATAAEEWYSSPAYQEILPLRTEHSRSMAGLLRGVPKDYRAVTKLEELMADAG